MYPTARRAAILAIGKPVALEASAELRDTRGFISMTTISPVARLSANWTLAPPVETPTARMTVRAASRSVCSSGSDRVITGATVAESPVCTPMGSMFSIEHTTTALSAPSRITSSSISAQPRTERSTSTWPIGLASSARARRSSSSAGVRAAPPPSPPSVKPGRRITGRPSSAAAARPAAMSPTTRLAGTARPAAAIVPRKASRSSARRIASASAPISSTPYRSRTASAESSIARFRAVCPPSVGSRASGRSRAMTASTASRSSGST